MVIEHLTEDQKDDRCLVLHQPSANQSRQDKVLTAVGTRQMLRRFPDDLHGTLLAKQLHPASSANHFRVKMAARLV